MSLIQKSQALYLSHLVLIQDKVAAAAVLLATAVAVAVVVVVVVVRQQRHCLQQLVLSHSQGLGAEIRLQCCILTETVVIRAENPGKSVN